MKIINVALLLIIIACNGKPSSNSAEQMSKIGTFNHVPVPVGGTCYFYLSEEDRKERKYLFINDFSESGYIRINEKVIRFNLVDYAENPGQNKLYVYSNAKDTVRIEIVSKDSLIRAVLFFSNPGGSQKMACIGECES